MYKGKKILAIIPARSGSKGLKDKNIKLLNGKPLIAYTIEAAQKSNIFEDIVVSTDSKQYAQIAMQYGATVPFRRPDSLATDMTSSTEVIIHALEELEKQGKTYDYFMLLQPTSPLRNEMDILKSIDLLLEKNANTIVSVCECEHSPVFAKQLGSDHRLDGFLSDIKNSRRQDIEPYYRLNGAIYLSNVTYFNKDRSFYRYNSYAYIMKKINSIDIDDLHDFWITEYLMKQKWEE